MPHKFIRRKISSFALDPGRWITRPFHRHYNIHYKERHAFPKIVFALDLVILGVVIGAAISAVAFFAFGRNTIAKQIDFSATVAPSEIMSGAPSTLVISWHNTSSEELRNVKVSLAYPAHFMLQNLSFLDQKIENNTVDVGDISPDGQGSVKVMGVMFGDVGGKQLFTSKMDFRYGEKNKLGRKETEHVFSPTASALKIDVSMPDIIVSEQMVNGVIHLTNAGSIDFSEIALNPTVSIMDFSISSPRAEAYEKKLGDRVVWIISGLESGASTDIGFTGVAPKQSGREIEEWGFNASFTFENETFFQSRTQKLFTLIPSPLAIEQETSNAFITPGGKLNISGEIKNISGEEVELKNIFLEVDSVFVARRDGDGAKYDKASDKFYLEIDGTKKLAADEKIEFDAALDIRKSIQTSSTSKYENLTVAITSGAKFEVLSSGTSATVRSERMTLSITSPISFSSLARYSTAQGDQIGRGPLPPVVGEETKYWVFWNISGTTNELKNVEITATLPPYAKLGKKQTASIGRQVSIDGNEVSWHIDSLSATFAPQSKTVGIAFEVGITPSEEHVGGALTILDDIQLTAVDAFTGEIVQAYGARINTDLPEDSMASGLSRVEKF